MQHETIYAARVGDAEELRGSPDHLAADGIRSARCLEVAELAQCPDEVWPAGLAVLAPMLLASDLNPDRPMDLADR